MKRTTAILLLFFLFHLPLKHPAAAELTIITEEFPPLNYTENGKLTGAMTDVVQEITGEDEGQQTAGPVARTAHATGWKQIQAVAEHDQQRDTGDEWRCGLQKQSTDCCPDV